MRGPVPRVAIIVDTSGSVADHLLMLAWTEVHGCLRQLGIRRDMLTVYAADTETRPLPGPPRRQVSLPGGDGTDMAAAIDVVLAARPTPRPGRGHHRRPDTLAAGEATAGRDRRAASRAVPSAPRTGVGACGQDRRHGPANLAVTVACEASWTMPGRPRHVMPNSLRSMGSAALSTTWIRRSR